MNPTGRHRVLLVEDNDLNRTLVRAILTRAADPVAQAVTLVEATDLAAAHAELAASPIDLILLDMQLPDGDGLSLAKELATETGSTRPVIIALTASVLPDQQDSVRAAGCDGFLGKPYHPRQLIDILAAHLRVDRAERPPGP
jgi:two-component system, OmpR family, KDP operon response regulator KdpE